MSMLINGTNVQHPVKIQDAFGNEDTVNMQPGGRVTLAPQSTVDTTKLPRGVHFIPDSKE